MLKDITIGQYYPTNSLIHKLDARIKLLSTFIFMISLFIINKFWPYLIVLLSILFVVNQSNIPGKYLLKGLLLLIYLIVILTIGTKTPLLSLGITIGMSFFYYIFHCLKKKLDCPILFVDKFYMFHRILHFHQKAFYYPFHFNFNVYIPSPTGKYLTSKSVKEDKYSLSSSILPS